MVVLSNQALSCAQDRGNYRNEFVGAVRHSDVGIDDMTPMLWKKMTHNEKSRWWEFWICKGHFAFQCECGYPVAFGGAPCAVCDPEFFKRQKSKM